MAFPRASYWFLVAVALVMALAHVCAAPFHAHAGAITTHAERESHHSGSDADEDAVHAASCDALKAPSMEQGGAVLLPVGTVPVVAAPPVHHLVEANASVVVGSPPLFLLHAALLI